MYYYFKKIANVIVDIVSFDHQINLLLNKWYQPLTQEQVDFYLQNPSASIQEIIDCQLTPPYIPPDPDVQEYISMRVQELKDVCYASITIDKLQCSMANAVLAGTSIAYAGKKHYSTSEAIAIMKQFMDESDKALTVYETYKPRIEAANTIKDVDTLYNQAISAL